MSRLIVKNLPNNVTVDQIKEKFSLKGHVTDVQLKYTKDGKFRKFGFVGYLNEDEAKAALEYFDNTFYNTSRLKVELCSELGSADKPKAWSKYAPDSSAHQKTVSLADETEAVKVKEKKKKKKDKTGNIDAELVEKIRKHKDEPGFMDFLEVHGKADNILQMVEDEDDDKSEKETSEEEKEEEEKPSLANTEISDLEYLKRITKGAKKDCNDESVQPSQEIKNNVKKERKDYYTIQIRNVPAKTTKSEIKTFFKPITLKAIRRPKKVRTVVFVGFETEKDMKRAMTKNKSFLKGSQVHLSKVQNKPSYTDTDNPRWKSQEESCKNEESIAESGRIFLRNLPYVTKEEHIQELFSKYGPVTEVIVPIDRQTRMCKGYGVVTFLMPEHAVSAYTALDGSIFQGRMLHLLPGKPKEDDNGGVDGTNYKAKKDLELKKTAGSSHNWNSLFLGQNAVVEVIADTYNATKAEVLTGSDAPVRLALGETKIVADTKKFLEENGVKIDAFNQAPVKRSKTIILAKNLPAKTTVAEIRSLFDKFGVIDRIILPPSGVTAIIEFLEPSEARMAFTKLAYSKFKYLPLYLEWAPEDALRPNTGIKEESTDEQKTQDEIIKQENESDSDEEELTPEPETTLFVKNINFDTTEETLKEHFSSIGKIAHVTVARKKDPSKPGKLLSMGYGFVQFYTKNNLNEALKKLQGSTLEGHVIELKRSNRTLQNEVVSNRKSVNVSKPTGSKLLVRNIPFEANEKELTKLFKTFGELKSVRLPRKMVGTGKHRGFGFVEFLTKHDAKRALKALGQSTHFLGRRLVLEWAEQDESVEEIRKRTAKHFHQEEAKRSKKATTDIMVEEDDDEA